jgi:predicted CopG family antitoxin
MRTTLTLDDDVYEAALKISKKSGERLGKVISRLARTRLPRRFPVFTVSPGTPAMSVESIDKFIEEEGLV